MAIRCPTCQAELQEGARYCASCGTPRLDSNSPTMTTDRPFVAAQPIGRLSSSDSIATGGFAPGTLLDGRYRIIGLIGRGGMGEVYRADDVKLGQPVALKFLPAAVHDDPVRRERLVAEVRIARQVSHPSVCRVYDLGEIDGRHFLSMEYIDGEDLASLLKRIGHLPGAKTLELARQVCAGLAAAHDRGVLHRDLKPANIMIDGRGRARVTDFGLAVAGDASPVTGAVEGTPAYMAPELLAGGPATVQSDIYALGLVLYELGTGARPFKARTLAELRAEKDADTITAPSEITHDLDPILERVILRCLDRDPRVRPASALQVAAALPGGDPLAAAIAAGETPSPEMVAASRTDEALKPVVAWTLLAVMAVGLVAAVALAPRAMVSLKSAPGKPPEVMAERARDVLRRLGHPLQGAVSASGIVTRSDYLMSVRDAGLPADQLDAAEGDASRFWYRQSPQPFARLGMDPPGNAAGVRPDDPALWFSGEVRVLLDREGRLRHLAAVPDQQVPPTDGPSAEPDWQALFAEAGLDPAAWREVPSIRTPFHYADRRAAWVPLDPRPGALTRIEAAAFQGRLTAVDVLTEFDRPERMASRITSTGERIGLGVVTVVVGSTLLGAIWVARRNLRMGRGDRRGAWRLASAAMLLQSVGWILSEDHQASVWEFYLLFLHVCTMLFLGALVAVLYLATEPYIRRLWPSTIVTWTRVLAGRIRDPLVARDVLIGAASGAVVTAIDFGMSAYGDSMWGPATALAGARYLLAAYAFVVLQSLQGSLVLLMLLFAARMALRRDWLAAAAVTAILAAPTTLIATNPVLVAIGGVLSLAIVLGVLAKFGLVATMTGGLVSNVLYVSPLTFDTSAWYAGSGLTGIVIVVALTVTAFAHVRRTRDGSQIARPSS